MYIVYYVDSALDVYSLTLICTTTLESKEIEFKEKCSEAFSRRDVDKGFDKFVCIDDTG